MAVKPNSQGQYMKMPRFKPYTQWLNDLSVDDLLSMEIFLSVECAEKFVHDIYLHGVDKGIIKEDRSEECPSCNGSGVVDFLHTFNIGGVYRNTEYECECEYCGGNGVIDTVVNGLERLYRELCKLDWLKYQKQIGAK